MSLKPAPKPTISVIIPHYDGLPQLRECLQALMAQSHAPDEIVVVDNGSPQGLIAVRTLAAAACPKAQTVCERRRGAAHARNAGVARSSGDVIVFVDSDVTPAADWLALGMDALARHPIVGGRVRVAPRDPRPVSPVEAWDILFGHNVAKVFKQSGHLLTGNLFVRRSVFDVVGEFRSGVPEDGEWCHRAIRQGYRLHYSEALVVTHAPLETLEALKERHIRFTRESYAWSKEQPAGQYRFWLRSLLVLASIVPHGTRIFTSSIGRLSLKAGVFKVLMQIRWLRFREAQRLLIAGLRR